MLYLKESDRVALEKVVRTSGTGAAKLAALQTWAAANIPTTTTGRFANLLAGALDDSGVDRTGSQGSLDSFTQDVETALIALPSVSGNALSAADAAALKAVVDATHASGEANLVAVQTLSAGTVGLLARVIAAGIIASGAYGTMGTEVPAAVVAFAAQFAGGFDQVVTFAGP